MRIEILFPEFCNLYGDLANMKYLGLCLPDAEFVETPLSETPLFVREKVDMIYMGPMTERAQEAALERLAPYKQRIWELIGQDVVFLFTGNALELLGESITKDDGSSIPCLEILPLTAQRDMMHRQGIELPSSLVMDSPSSSRALPVNKMCIRDRCTTCTRWIWPLR